MRFKWKTSNSWDQTFDSTILVFATAKGSKLDNSDYPKHEDIDVNDIQTWIILEYLKLYTNLEMKFQILIIKF